MKLAYMHPDDLIEVNKGGRRMVGRVVEIRDGVVQFEPLCRRYVAALATGTPPHARSSPTGARRGAGDRDPPMRQTCQSQPLCRAHSCPCASRRKQSGRTHAGTQDHPCADGGVNICGPTAQHLAAT
jgi:hypothetical protein